ncbi:MAG TPA: hypothetical protein VFC85_00095 [Verrucomicrobiae bacterium]|nr:hypothetical protein [Verrucomicrobiae bacterium]
MNTVDDIPLNARSLSYRWDGYDYTLKIDDEHLTVEWHSAGDSRTTRTPLKDLKPELPVERWVSSAARKNGRLGTGLLVAVVVVYFSDIQAHVPLLAPVMLLFSISFIYWAVRGSLPFSKTTIRGRNDSYIASIPHLERLKIQRRAFEETLLRMIKKARGDYAD